MTGFYELFQRQAAKYAKMRKGKSKIVMRGLDPRIHVATSEIVLSGYPEQVRV
jgi:hypothetical protein